jgi:hypothetical protein
MTLAFLLRGGVKEAGIRRAITRLELADAVEVSRVGDDDREFLDLFELIQFRSRLSFIAINSSSFRSSVSHQLLSNCD